MEEDGRSGEQRPTWLLITSHGLVLLYIAAHPQETIREISDALGLTQRRVVSVVQELATSGLLEVERKGRKNHYQIVEDAHLLHPTMSHVRVSDFIALLKGELPARRA